MIYSFQQLHIALFYSIKILRMDSGQTGCLHIKVLSADILQNYPYVHRLTAIIPGHSERKIHYS